MPLSYIPPCAPTVQAVSPAGPNWVHEVKFDGYRIQLHKHGHDVVLYSRKGVDFTARFPSIARAVAALPAKSVILDGELVAMNALGVADFRALHLKRVTAADLSVWVFDLMHLNGVDTRPKPLLERRARLERLMQEYEGTHIRLSQTFPDAAPLLNACKEHKLEGVVSKRIDRPYASGGCNHWIKVKCPAWREEHRNRFKLFEPP